MNMKEQELEDWFENKKQELEELNKEKQRPHGAIEEKLDNIESGVFAIVMLILVYFVIRIFIWLYNTTCFISCPAIP